MSGKARIRERYEAQYADPIQVKAGAAVHVGRTDEENAHWLWCRAADGREGWVPIELISEERPVGRALADYSAKELAVKEGEEVEIEEMRHGWARVRNRNGEAGWIPESKMFKEGS